MINCKYKAEPLDKERYGDIVEGSLVRINDKQAVIIPFDYPEDEVKTILWKYNSYDDDIDTINSIDVDCIEIDINTIFMCGQTEVTRNDLIDLED
jgi:hypothetical protein